ncbi:hypothetical protein AVEN_87678-1 [Araneus ventricosus]|uniref:Uncharacterized protein n=1 Tax=Araneus ventricosus TaxID=182803 RepID=A0A4Y2CYZ6_ARAVE|nr:hypothetical protein AVEN_87678-1 [Araneus ventricosus]
MTNCSYGPIADDGSSVERSSHAAPKWMLCRRIQNPNLRFAVLNHSVYQWVSNCWLKISFCFMTEIGRRCLERLRNLYKNRPKLQRERISSHASPPGGVFIRQWKRDSSAMTSEQNKNHRKSDARKSPSKQWPTCQEVGFLSIQSTNTACRNTNGNQMAGRLGIGISVCFHSALPGKGGSSAWQ